MNRCCRPGQIDGFVKSQFVGGESVESEHKVVREVFCGGMMYAQEVLAKWARQFVGGPGEVSPVYKLLLKGMRVILEEEIRVRNGK